MAVVMPGTGKTGPLIFGIVSSPKKTLAAGSAVYLTIPEPGVSRNSIRFLERKLF
jgi:hypothetical protein